MTKKYRSLILVILTTMAVACGNSSTGPAIEADRVDEDRLIRYGMPEGWTNTRISSGRHYTREGMPDDPTILQVAPRKNPSSVTIEMVQEGARGKHELQGHTIVRESTMDKNGFTRWEAVYEAYARGEDVVYHDFFLFADGLLVEINLNTREADHGSYVGDLLAVVDSVAANNPDYQ